MKLENAQIEIKGKEHYEAVKKRLQELGKWVWHNADNVELQAKEKRYEMTISKANGGRLCWGSLNGAEIITLDDLYEVEKEKVIKHKFVVVKESVEIGFYNPKEREHSTYEAAEKYISLQKAGTSWSIKKITTIVEE